MFRKILIIFGILGITLAASVVRSEEKKSSKELLLDEEIALVDLPVVVVEESPEIATLENVEELPSEISPVFPSFLPLDYLRNGTIPPPIVPLRVGPRPLALRQQPGIYLERYFWPFSKATRSIYGATPQPFRNLRSHTPYHIQPGSQSYYPAPSAFNYAAQAIPGGLTAGVPQYYYTLPYDNYGYYYDYYYEDLGQDHY